MSSSGTAAAGGISRFFAPKRSQDTTCAGGRQAVAATAKNDSPSAAMAAVQEDQDGWQRPVGLTRADAIEIDDDSDDDKQCPENDACAYSSTAGRPDSAVEISYEEPVTHVPVHVESRSEIEIIVTPSDDRTTKKAEVDAEVGADYSVPLDQDQSSSTSYLAEDAEKYIDTGRDKDDTSQSDPAGASSNNPFAEFAFSSAASSSSSLVHDTSSLPTSRVEQNDTSRRHETNDRRKRANNKNSDISNGTTKAKQKENKKRRTNPKNKCDDYIPIRNLPVEEQERIKQKWQSLGDSDAPLEIRRFQVLVAARLHAQSREPTVRVALDNLRRYFAETNADGDDAYLCAKALSRADPKVIAGLIPSILFANTKAEHIVKAAKEIRSRFGGVVPETQTCLKEITGIGAKLSDILSFTNSRKAYSVSASDDL